jgi:serine phosphatase RsbU (regulator of sigma subunit)/pSer/pThr/pTyr-binding forkhead associated (FHA) protein
LHRLLAEVIEMASLHILKGQNPGQRVTLDADKVVLGRDPECQVVIPMNSVSRKHAHIVRQAGKYFIEDLQSRNGTYVNHQAISQKTPLKNNDRIRICDFLATFYESAYPPLPADLRKGDDEAEADEPEGSTTVEASISHSSHFNLVESQPAEKLKALLEISGNLSKTLQLDELLPKIVDSLFQVFRQADRCFIIQAEDGNQKLIPKVIKTRRPQDESNARFSRSIVRQCLETNQAFLSDDASADKRIPLSQSVLDFRIRSVMCAPLCSAEGKAFGVIQLDTQDRSKKFTQDDLKLLVCVANQAAVALENARFHEEQVARERLKRDLELATQVQLSFLPQQLPEVPGYEFFAHYEPALQVGGDYYGFVPLSGGRLAITVGDVAGKGIPAALLMAKLSSDTRFCLLTQPDAAQALIALNDLLYPYTSPMDRFVTLAMAVLDPKAHTVTLVSGGHPSPLLYHKSEGVLMDAMPRDVPGVPLGMLEGCDYGACQIMLKPGDSLTFFSDGVPDALDVNNASFGTEGIQATLKGAGPVSARPLGERLSKAVKQHAAGRSQHDDITLVCLSRTG